MAGAAASGEEFTGIGGLRASPTLRVLPGVVGQLRASQRIAFGVVGEGIRVLAGILLRLAEREFEMQALVVIQAAMPQLPLHRGDVAGIEAHGLQVGQAPPGATETGVQLDRSTVGDDRPVGLAFGLQRMAQAHPHPRFLGAPVEDGFVQPDRAAVIAELAQHDRLQVLQVGVAGIGGEQGFHFDQCVFVAVAAIQHQRVVVARHRETGRQPQAVFQQRQRLFVAPDPRAEFGQHAHRCDVHRHAAQALAQFLFRLGQVARAERSRRRHQRWIVPAAAHMHQVGVRRLSTQAGGVEQAGEIEPHARQPRLQLRRPGDRGNRFVAPLQRGQDDAQFELRARRARLFRDKRFKHSQRLRMFFLGAECHALDQSRPGFARHGDQDLPGLFGGKVRILRKQAHRMGQRGIHAGSRLRSAHPVTCPRRRTARPSATPGRPPAGSAHSPRRWLRRIWDPRLRRRVRSRRPGRSGGGSHAG